MEVKAWDWNLTDEAGSRFEKLVNFGKKHLSDEVKIDYFAVSIPDLLIWEEDLPIRNEIHCRYMLGLGHLGPGNSRQVHEELDIVINLNVNHQGAHTGLNLMDI